MNEPLDRLESLFAAALKTPPANRAAYLDQACGDEPALRRRVEALLVAQQAAGSFLESAASPDASHAGGEGSGMEGGPTVAQAMLEQPGTVIGPYKLLQQIGEGGMGVVWMAEQTQPVQRKVALKVIKPGMDSRQVIARFEAERQALAMMDHVNIARVFDGGATETGRPYFVMELVHGVPITKYCDDNHLTPRERLELFVPVCQAIQHAHQKGIIHRDIKPSNVMVTLYDGKPVAKVIDFGVAKATEQKLTERTLFTQYGTMVGTLEYMSPEQAEMSALGVDTRSDIYSLGVLLYELLTGSTPLTSKRMKEAAYAEILRMIKEEEPPKPSKRLSDSGEALASISANRHTEPARLTKLVRGELDWIVMKTLEKDRNRRYETANGFAADLQRYLNDETVQACPPSAGYRFRKFARRNKRGLAVAALVLFFLVLLGSGAGWAVRDRAAREAEMARQRMEREAKVAGQVELILDEGKRLEQEQKWPEALAVARRAESALAGGDADTATRERIRKTLSDLEMVARLEEIRLSWGEVGADGMKVDGAGTARRYAAAFRENGVDVERLPADQAAAQLRSRTAVFVPLAAALDDWGRYCRETRDDRLAKVLWTLAGTIDADRWRLRVRQAVAARDVAGLVTLADSPDTAQQPPQSQVLLAQGLRSGGRVAVAIVLLERASEAHPADFWIHFELALLNSSVRPTRPEAAVRHSTVARALRPRNSPTWNNLGVALKDQGKLDEAIACYRKAIELKPDYVMAHSNLGGALADKGKLDEAIDCYRKAIEFDPKYAFAHYNLGNALKARGKLDEAIACYRKTIELDPKYAPAHHNLGNALRDQNKLDEAIACYRKAIALKPDLAWIHHNLGRALTDKGVVEEAIACYRKAIALDPKYAQAHTNLGNALHSQKKLDEAIACHRKAIALDPKYAPAHNNLGMALHNQKKLDEAIAYFRKAIELKPDDAMAHSNLGAALADKGKQDEAIDCYRKAIELDPKYAPAHYNLGIALKAQGKLDEAIAAYRKAIELQPDCAPAHRNLGVALYGQGKLDEAIASYGKGIELQPDYAPAHRNLGVALARQGKLAEAIACYRKAIEVDPKFAEPHNDLAWFLATAPDLKLRDPKSAVELAAKAVELDPKNPSYPSTLGAARYRVGEWKTAITDLEKSMELRKGGDATEWFFLAMSHWQLGEKEEARKWYDRAVAWMDKNNPKDEELRRFRQEAAKLLKVEDLPKPVPKSK